ncbi:MAG TPA: TonB-dependent receptor [Flavobacteriales bacterium]|nr:TonB-dependent receptor [Flavobacteriales bacterium]
MKVFFFIPFFVFAHSLMAQHIVVDFKKEKGYAVDISFFVFDMPQHLYMKRNVEVMGIKVNPGNYKTKIEYKGYEKDTVVLLEIAVQRDTVIDLDKIAAGFSYMLEEVEITDAGSVFSKVNLKQVDGFAIYAGKKTEVINIANTKANLATNNGRQVFAKIAGLNIWESDAGGIQLGIGGRGLSPNRTSNFNTRQNGYDVSADALGYPESYYSPVPDFVERIEVVRGASSLQYGTQFGGLVNFKMRKAKQDRRMHAVAKGTYGSFDFMNVTGSLSYGTPEFGVYAAGQFKKGNGFRDHTGFTNRSFFVNMFYNIKRRITIGADFTKMYYVAQQPGGLTDDLFNKNTDTVLRKRNWFQVNWNLVALYTVFHFTDKVKLNTRFFGLMSDRSNVGYLGQINRPDLGQPREVIAGEFRNMGNETRLLANYKTLKNTHTFLVGARVYRGQTTALQGLAKTQGGPDFNFKNPDDIDYSNYLFPSRNVAAFAENIFRMGEKLTITPGARFEYIDTRSQGYYYQRNFDLAGDTLLEIKNNTATQNQRSIFLAGIGVSYKPKQWMEFFANASQNYRAINFSDIAIVNPNFKVDPTMKDERGYTLDAGFRGNFNNWISYDVSGFYLSYNNRIGEVFKVDEFSYNIVRYRTNIGNSTNYGIESFIELDLIKMIDDSSQWSLPVFANYSFIEAYYGKSDENAVEGKRVEFVPQQMLRSGFSLSYKKCFVSYNYSYVGEQYSDATNAQKVPNAVFGIIPAYWVMDAGAGVEYKFLRAEVHVNNLTNNYYFTRRAASYPGPGIIPSEIRNVYFTLGVTF